MLNKLQNINFGLKRHTLPVILQTEAAECGIACLSMITAWHNHAVDLREMRLAHGVSQKGLSLAQLIDVARRCHFSTRSLRLELTDLNKLRLPCILHWDMTHFVVLHEVGHKKCVIHDPAIGRRVLSLEEVSRSFTGIALELTPDDSFTTSAPPTRVKIGQLVGRIVGLKSSLIYVLLLALAIEFISLLVPLFSQWTIDDVVVSSDRHLLLILMLGYGLILLTKQIMSLMRAWVMMFITTSVRVQWQGSVLRHLISLPVAFFERRNLGDLVSRFGAVDAIQGTLSSSFLVAVLDGLFSIITLIMMILYSGWLTLIPCAAIVLYVIGRLIWYRPLLNASQEQIIHAAKQNSHFLETMRGIKTLKLFQKNYQRSDDWLTLLVNQLNAGVRTQKLQILFQQLNGLLFAADNLLVLALGATMVIDQRFTVGLLMAFISYKSQFLDRVRNLVDNAFAMKMLSIQTERLADIILTQPETTSVSTYSEVERLNAPPELAFSHVSFHYSIHENAVLKEVSFTVKAGECVALTGASGCGKTTAGQLLLGCLQPTQGEILVNGTPLSRFGLERLRSFSAAVLQDDVLFAGTILDNITFFGTDYDMEFVVKCAQLAAIHHDILAMPMQYNTVVGDMGSALSGGQKQRLFLARALFRKPQFLLLDEATSNLDLFHEQTISEALKSLNITRLIIAHRPHTLMMVDRIIILDQGQVAGEHLPADLFPALQGEKA
ncbi:peptidase domain-containing ABC transporter [Atlantibacter hermannii]|uniref:peptidase domain-containing ABC transporter n=1 Tax=Atlantibacter hermannii TaxID=565 RepID=UPI0028AE54C7|nr:peptidase domain-containing ABC transporter [Atlantibacter hermannii]